MANTPGPSCHQTGDTHSPLENKENQEPFQPPNK